MFSPTPSPISRTVAYRKITKPLLERKRRARINRCLDELKDLMYSALEAEGENVEKLEKADILEFTVRHLQKITRRDPVEEAYKFQEGFSHCASEACSFLLSLPGLDSVVGRRLVEYLAKSVSRALESQVAATNKHPAATAQVAAASPVAAAAAAAAANTCGNGSGDDSNGDEAVARGRRTPPSSNPPPAPPGAVAAPPCPAQQATVAATVSPPQKPVALTASNRGPHTVVRPKPTRPAFGRSSSSSPQSHDVAAAAAAAAAQRDPMWRPW